MQLASHTAQAIESDTEPWYIENHSGIMSLLTLLIVVDINNSI